MVNPIEQFEIRPLIPLQIGGVDISFTNSSLFMCLAVILAAALMTLSVRGRALVPGRWQALAEMAYEFVANMIRENVGMKGWAYFHFIFTLFMFVLFGNLLGLIPYTFTYTSHIIVTFAMAIFVFVGVTVIGFCKHGLHYFRMFFPKGAPAVTALILVPIEIISYLSRPISLAVRLFANMLAGHIMLVIIASFVTALGILGVLPLAFLSGIIILEFLIAALQAYVFTILTCIYLNDAINMH